MIRTKKAKIQMFMNIADSDGNGLLSYEEVFHLASISMKKNFIYSNFDY